MAVYSQGDAKPILDDWIKAQQASFMVNIGLELIRHPSGGCNVSEHLSLDVRYTAHVAEILFCLSVQSGEGSSCMAFCASRRRATLMFEVVPNRALMK